MDRIKKVGQVALLAGSAALAALSITASPSYATAATYPAWETLDVSVYSVITDERSDGKVVTDLWDFENLHVNLAPDVNHLEQKYSSGCVSDDLTVDLTLTIDRNVNNVLTVKADTRLSDDYGYFCAFSHTVSSSSKYLKTLSGSTAIPTGGFGKETLTDQNTDQDKAVTEVKVSRHPWL
jgi:hypothetical protein